MQRLKILYFIDGPHPTPAQLEKAAELNASFRNVSKIVFRSDTEQGTPVERCDAVCGRVIPPQYKEAGIELIKLSAPAPTNPILSHEAPGAADDD